VCQRRSATRRGPPSGGRDALREGQWRRCERGSAGARGVAEAARGYLHRVTTNDPVPEADRLEQDLPADKEQRRDHRPHAEAAEADAYEQELPLSDAGADSGIDAERREPLGDDEDTARG
jgi:hypothetical protein